MKKLALLAFMLVATLTIGCTKDIEENEGGGRYLRSFRATIDQVEDTRASVNLKQGENYGKVEWSNGDQVLVFNGTQTATFTYSSSKDLFETSETFSATGNYTAVYPASICSGFDASRNASISIPAVQTYMKDGVVSAPMLANTESGEVLNFKNICGILRFRMQGTQTISGITLRTVGANVAGAATVSKSGVWTMGTETEARTVSITDTEVVLSSSESIFHVVLPAQLYIGGLELDVTFAGGGNSLQSTTKNISITASQVDGMALFTASNETFSGGKGTDADPYLLGTTSDLKNLAVYCSSSATSSGYSNACYRLTRNLDMSAVSGMSPIGPSETLPFTGSFDGCGHTIKGLVISKTGETATPCALFGYVKDAKISNINLADANIQSEGRFCAGIAGIAEKSTITGCEVGGLVKNTYAGTELFDGYACSVAGGICAYAISSTLEGCTFSGYANTNKVLGGIVGYTSGCEIKSCSLSSTGQVDCYEYFVGGIVGRARYNTNITSCVVDGDVASYKSNYVGGIVGHLTSGVASHCHFTLNGTVSGYNDHAGGIVGALQANEEANMDSSNLSAKVIDCLSEGPVSGSKNVGGVCGYMGASSNHSATVESCVAKGNVNANGSSTSSSYLPMYTGGVVGEISASGDCHVIGCKSYGDVYSSGHSVGGIVGYAIAIPNVSVRECISFSNLRGTYAIGGIVGYVKCNNANCHIDLVNDVYAGKKIDCFANNGSNGYSMATGLVGWWQATAGSGRIINCCSRVEEIYTVSKFGTYSTGNNCISGIVGFQNGSPTAVELYGCYSTIDNSGMFVDGKSKADGASLSLYGGIYSKIHSGSQSITTFANCYYNPNTQVGPSSHLLTKLDPNTVKAYTTKEALLTSMNDAVSAYKGSCTYELKNWVSDTDGWPVIEGMSTEKPASTAKRVSVIGDSISTYRGYVPNGYSCHYPTEDGNVRSVAQTYWYRLISNHMKDAILDRNIAFSGTAVTRTTNTSYSDQKWFGNDYCTRFINMNGVGSPDIILFHGGTNDYGHNVDPLAPGIEMRSATRPSDQQMDEMIATANAADTYEKVCALNDTTFCEAYLKLIRLCETKYPDVKIVCIIGDYLTTGIEQSILYICDKYACCKPIDLLAVNGYNDQVYMPKHDYNPSTGKGCHPSSQAMEFIADKIYKELGAWLEE